MFLVVDYVGFYTYTNVSYSRIKIQPECRTPTVFGEKKHTLVFPAFALTCHSHTLKPS